MHTYRLALIGFGNVGQGLAQILADRGNLYADRFGAYFKIIAVSDLLYGRICDPDGLDPAVMLHTIQAEGNLENVPGARHGWDALGTIAESEADIVVEVSYTDLKTGEPAMSHIRRALELGKHVVTTNKGPIALHFPQLRALAQERGVEIGVEGTVFSGSPALRLGLDTLTAAGVYKAQGILNGTTNFILTHMENGATYPQALAEAQEKGYAEADPRNDVEGHDAAAIVVILANLLMDLPLTMQDVRCEGITHLTQDDFVEAQAQGERWKLLGAMERTTEESFTASVQPLRLPTPIACNIRKFMSNYQ
jgi:homoserine dehydrogenase